MEQITTIGLDIAKHVFHAHGADEHGRMQFSKRVSRSGLLAFFAAQPRCVVALEACAGAHHWGRELRRLGRLIAPVYEAVRQAAEERCDGRASDLRGYERPAQRESSFLQ